MKFYIFLMAIFGCGTLATSCSDWLDVEPSTETDRNTLFQNEAGFADAMSGVYVSMSSDELYGKNTTWYLLELLGGGAHVDMGTNATLIRFPFIEGTIYYGDNYRNTYIDPIWNKAYATIANINSILEVIDKKQSVFQGSDYEIFKGEALGLRAFLHFDLLRMFGDAYSGPNYSPTKTYIPYVSSLTSNVHPLLTLDQCCNLILKDLEEAKNLLQADPIYTNEIPSPYVCSEVTGIASARVKYNIKDWHNRRFHFNYYAAVATMARVYQWMGNKEKALECALEVINAPEGTFTWIASELVSNITSTSEYVARDRTFSTEHIFAMNISDMQSRIDGYMIQLENSLSNGDVLGFNHDNFDAATMQFDLRYKVKATYSSYGSEFWLSTKYYKDNDPQNYSPWSANRVPLIRLSEMYYIAAECEPDLDLAINYLETVRQHRGLASYPLSCDSKDELQTEIEREYRKEFIAEGQLFYYHKRLNKSYTNMTTYENIQVDTKWLTFPRPDDEDTYGGRN